MRKYRLYIAVALQDIIHHAKSFGPVELYITLYRLPTHIVSIEML